MRIEKDCTHPVRTSPNATTRPPGRPLPENAFSPSFLLKARTLTEPTTESEALLSGPIDVEEVVGRSWRLWAVARRAEPVEKGGRAFAAFHDRPDALLLASVLRAAARANPFTLGEARKRRGYPVHRNGHCIGHLAGHEPSLLPYLHLATVYASNPDALALLLEAIGYESLALLGRLLTRRIERAPDQSG